MNMQAQLRATKTPGFQDSYSQDFPSTLGKKPQNQQKSKANPQHKILNNEKYTESLRDHGASYQTGQLNSDMPIESLGSRNINQSAVADGCFSAEDLMRKHRNPQQEVQRNHNRADVNEGIAKQRLDEFSLESLTLTKAGKFDGRSRETKEYLTLCENADVEPYQYYNENIDRQAGNHHQEDEEEEEQIQNGGNQEAWSKLRDFPLSSLKITQESKLDMRKGNSKEFMALCEAVGVHPLEFYFEHCNGQDDQPEPAETLVESIPNYQPASYEKSNKIREPVYQNHQHQRDDIDQDKEAALAKLREFPLNELWLTKKNALDLRKNNTKDYLLLCNSAGVNAMDYYFDNVDNPSNNMNLSQSVRSTGSEVKSVMSKTSTNSQKSELSDQSNLSLTKDSKLDKRFKSTKDFIKEKISEAELRLSQFDTSQLRKKSNGELDKRFKVNKEYLELQEQTQESYWENMKFN